MPYCHPQPLADARHVLETGIQYSLSRSPQAIPLDDQHALLHVRCSLHTLLQPAYAPIVVERDRNSVFFITPCNCRPCAPQATLLVKPPSFSLALRVHLFSALLRHKQPPTFHRLFPGASVLTHRPPAWLQTSSSLAEARLPGAEPHDAAAATARLDAGQHALSFGCHEVAARTCLLQPVALRPLICPRRRLCCRDLLSSASARRCTSGQTATPSWRQVAAARDSVGVLFFHYGLFCAGCCWSVSAAWSPSRLKIRNWNPVLFLTLCAKVAMLETIAWEWYHTPPLTYQLLSTIDLTPMSGTSLTPQTQTRRRNGRRLTSRGR